MNNTIEFYHPDETLVYHIQKSVFKLVFLDHAYFLIGEIESTDDLYHVEEDSLQNDYPQVRMTIDDFPLSVNHLDDLIGKTIEIPTSSIEVEDEDGLLDEIFYTNLQVELNDYELNRNRLYFFVNDQKQIQVRWQGLADDFTEEVNDGIAFDLVCLVDSEQALKQNTTLIDQE